MEKKLEKILSKTAIAGAVATVGTYALNADWEYTLASGIVAGASLFGASILEIGRTHEEKMNANRKYY